MTRGKSLYIHIPFCRKKCPYCHFFVSKFKQENIDSFTDILIKEILTKDFQESLTSIYFGGGTPYLLGPSNVARILKICPQAEEITLEANPEDVTFEEMKEFKDAGINRVSIGVQSFDNNLLSFLGRHHSAEKAMKSIESTYAAGIENISIDLMYDIPNQTREMFLNTLAIASHLPIKHLSLYNLTIEPFTPFHKKKKALEVLRPCSNDSTLMLSDAVSALEEMGLFRYEISAFAHKGFASKHNTGYWEGRPFHGVGPSAFSYIDNARFQNVCNLKKYQDSVENGTDPKDFYEKLDPLKSEKELLMTGIRMLKGICKTKFAKSLQSLEKEVEKLLQDGFIYESDNGLALSEKGLLFYDDVAMELI